VLGEPIRAGKLVPILVDEHHVEPLPFYAVYPHARVRSPKVTSMMDFLIEKFAHAPWRFDARRRPVRKRSLRG
jgi:DNA-binding transcriptional LysR family regulator